MSNPYVGEIRLVGFNFNPVNWMLCQGQLLPISDYTTLYNLLGTTYGGDGVQTFGLPNLSGRMAIHQGTGSGLSTFFMGQASGSEYVTLNANQIPSHSHSFLVNPATGTLPLPTNNYLAASSEGQYANSGGSQTAPMLTLAGSGQSHENRHPFLCINYIISLYGVYPSQS